MSQTNSFSASSAIRHDWANDEVQALFDLPFNDLLFMAQSVHRQHFNPNKVLTCTSLGLKC